MMGKALTTLRGGWAPGGAESHPGKSKSPREAATLYTSGRPPGPSVLGSHAAPRLALPNDFHAEGKSSSLTFLVP